MKKKILTAVIILSGLMMLLAVPSFAAEKVDVAEVYITSDDVENQGREWVDSSKEHKATGSMLMRDGQGGIIYEGALKQIKSRGNSTWIDPKKPYQVKLQKACDLCGTGLDEEENKTWILLSNYTDDSLLRNQLTFRIAEAIGMAYTPHCRQVDLYYDGEYRGMYLLCEKTEAGTGRVDINDLEKDIEKANPGLEADQQPTVIGSTEKGLRCQTVENLVMPDRDGGYLLELEKADRVVEEASWFQTKRGQFVVVKSPEYLPMTGMNEISGIFQTMENAVYNGGTDPESGKDYREIVDIESLAKAYLIEELSQDVDAFASSFYFYKPDGEEKLYAGPVWDFDLTFGNIHISQMPLSTSGFGAAKTDFGTALLNIPSFQEEVKKIYKKQLYNAVKDTAADVPAWSDVYADHVSGNSEKWPENTVGDGRAAQTALMEYLLERNGYLYYKVMRWNGSAMDFRGTFFDVSPDAWYFDDVKYADCHDLMNGTGAGIFSPQKTMTRAMIVTVLYRLAGSPDVDHESTFKDVPSDMWYSRAIAWAEENAITNGVGKGLFGLNDNIRREDCVALIHRCEGSPAGTAGLEDFRDESEVAEYALDPFRWAVEKEIIQGDDKMSLRPAGALTRAETAAIIRRWILTCSPVL